MSPFWVETFWVLLELRMMEVVVTTGAIRHTKLQSTPTLMKAKTKTEPSLGI